jgi:hypothetical protein
MVQKRLKVCAKIPYDEASFLLSLYVFMAFLRRHDVHHGGPGPSGLFRRQWVILWLDADDDGCFYIEGIAVGRQRWGFPRSFFDLSAQSRSGLYLCLGLVLDPCWSTALSLGSCLCHCRRRRFMWGAWYDFTTRNCVNWRGGGWKAITCLIGVEMPGLNWVAVIVELAFIYDSRWRSFRKKALDFLNLQLIFSGLLLEGVVSFPWPISFRIKGCWSLSLRKTPKIFTSQFPRQVIEKGVSS